MHSLLDSVSLDIEEILDELRAYWVEGPNYEYNPTAFTKMKSVSGNIMCCCPYETENRPSFGITEEYPYVFNCYGCGKSGNLASLVAHAVDLPTEVHGEHFILKNFISTSITDKVPPLNIESILDNKNKPHAVFDHEVEHFRYVRHPYLYQRGFTELTLQKYEVGYDVETRSMAIPVRDLKGDVRFIKRRSIDSRRFLNTKDTEKKDVIYGLYYLMKSRKPITELYLNESETDTMSCYQGRLPAGAILGRILFKEQIHNLQKSGIKTLNLFYDNDKAGVDATIQSFEHLKKTPIQVNVILYPGNKFGVDTDDYESILYKDANDLLKADKLKDIEKVSYLEWITMLKI